MSDANDPLERIAPRLAKKWKIIAAAKFVFGSVAALLVLITALLAGGIVRAHDQVQIKLSDPRS